MPVASPKLDGKQGSRARIRTEARTGCRDPDQNLDLEQFWVSAKAVEGACMQGAVGTTGTKMQFRHVPPRGRLSSGSSDGKPKRPIHMLTGTTGTQIQFRRVPLHGRVSSDSSSGKLEQSKVK